MKNKNNYIKIFAIFAYIVTIILGIINIKYSEKTTLTQLSAQGSRQMMGYLMKTPGGKLVVIDGGTAEDTNNLISKINENGGKVDYWFITHAHDDHAGAFVQIINNTDIPIDNIYVSANELNWYEKNEPQRIDFTRTLLETLSNEKIASKVKEPKINENIEIDTKNNIKAEILGIRNPEITENAGNEQSMVVKFYIDKKSLLILGDTGTNSSKKLLETQKEKLKSDIVQMAHHGQKGATQELYEVINPKICMWPTPGWLWNNDAGEGIDTGPWETMETRRWIENLNVEKNYVAIEGDIKIFI